MGCTACTIVSIVFIIAISAGFLFGFFLLPEFSDSMRLWFKVIYYGSTIFTCISYCAYATQQSPNKESSDLTTNPEQLDSHGVSLSVITSTPKSVEVSPEQNEVTLTSYNELYEHDKPPPTYQQCQVFGPGRLTQVQQNGLATANGMNPDERIIALPSRCHRLAIKCDLVQSPIYEECQANSIHSDAIDSEQITQVAVAPQL